MNELTEEQEIEELNRRIDEICYLLSSIKPIFSDHEYLAVQGFKEFIRMKRVIKALVRRNDKN